MANETASGGEFRLLVIDDDMIQRTIISRIGSQAGYKVVGAQSYEAAVDALTAQKFDCITLDLSLGEQSGALLLRTIVDTGNLVPVVVISGAEEHVLATTVKVAQSLGLDSIPFRKPLNLIEVRAALTRKREGATPRRVLEEVCKV